MIKTNFPINDLRRRRFQTGITITTLMLSVASTLFLLFFSNRLGIGATSATAGALTQGLTAILSQFILFEGALIFAIGAVLTTFVAHLTMAQRTKDFGLIKAAGCPNNLVGGYYMSELLTTTLIGCILGVIFGFLMDYGVSVTVLSGYSLPNFWFAPLIFASFFVLAFVFGLQPIIKAAKMSPLQALSPVTYYGLNSTNTHKALSRRALTWRIAVRSMVRRQSASLRIILLLSIVFVLLTVSIAGGVIASDTTSAWIQKPIDKNTLVIAHSSMGNQYRLLLSKFSGDKGIDVFNYSDKKLAIPQTVISQVSALSSVSVVDSRLILDERVSEISSFTVNPSTGQTFSVGDNRQANVIVIGVNSQKLAGGWFVQGRFLDVNDGLEAVIGDSIAHTMYSPGSEVGTSLSDPLLESIAFSNDTFRIVGVCVDPTNNGFVIYVPIEKLMNLTGSSNPNLLLVMLNNIDERSTTLTRIKAVIQSNDPDLNVFTINDVVTKNTDFLASSWKTIMLLPIFTLVSGALCLLGYMMLAVDEQHQELAVLRAVGAKQKVVLAILAIQSIVVLFSSFSVGIFVGIILTIIVLMHQPLVTSFTIVEITAWLLAALASMFILSFYPALRLAKTSILKIMT